MTRSPDHFDVCIVGAGVAGLSLAAELSGRCRVVVLEAEAQPGAHATGRSAALFTTTYGEETVRALTAASEPFFRDPPAGFTGTPLLKPRGCLYVAAAGRQARLAELAVEIAPHCPEARLLSRDELQGCGPPLLGDAAAAGLFDASAADIDVHGLMTGFLRAARARGAELSLGHAMVSAERDRAGWRLITSAGELRCECLVDAAGAWADQVAQAAGVAPVGLEPRRRSMVCIEAPAGAEISAWPFVVDVDMSVYFKPDAGRLIVSPADETPSPPCDAQPEELDIAIAIDRFERMTGLAVRRVINRWAGLRTFVADERPVAGFDAGEPGFFWLAGQGGFGVQTAPAMARLAAAAVLGEGLPADLVQLDVDPKRLAPDRLR